MRHSLSSRAAGLALVAVLCGHAAAGINAVSSSDDQTADAIVSAAVGSVLTIDGDGFGTAKPKVFLTDGVKKYTLKVTAFSDTQITAQIKKAVAGDLTLDVQPKGADPFTFESVTIESPVIDQLLDHETLEVITSAEPNLEFVITGSFFGSKKGKIFIGGKKAKVTSWAGGEIHVLMPKSLANGLWDILLDNKVATDGDEQITMTGSLKKVGKVSLTVTVGTGPTQKTITYAYKENATQDPEYLAFGGSTAGFPLEVTGLVIHFDPATSSVPADIESGSGNPLMTISFSNAMKGPSKFVPGDFASWLVIPGSEGFVVHMTSSGGGQAGGTFEADLPLLTPTNSASAVFGDANPLHIEGIFVCEQASG
ncbi:MAG TPA: hypothetical protein VFY71_16690 [Planctomycetota bacterium]|nr:hypothetical protein [Planctomycetota bacterium]